MTSIVLYDKSFSKCEEIPFWYLDPEFRPVRQPLWKILVILRLSLNLSSHLRYYFLSDYFPRNFLHWNSDVFLVLSITVSPRPLHWLNVLTKLRGKHMSQRLSLFNCIHFQLTSFINIFFNSSFPDMLNLYFCLRIADRVSQRSNQLRNTNTILFIIAFPTYFRFPSIYMSHIELTYRWFIDLLQNNVRSAQCVSLVRCDFTWQLL
jgi:hypothetical protein